MKGIPDMSHTTRRRITSPDDLDRYQGTMHVAFRRWGEETVNSLWQGQLLAGWRADPEPFGREPSTMLRTCVAIMTHISISPRLVTAVGVDEIADEIALTSRRTVSRALSYLTREGYLLRPKRGTKGNGVSLWKLPLTLARSLLAAGKRVMKGKQRRGYAELRAQAAQRNHGQHATKAHVVNSPYSHQGGVSGGGGGGGGGEANAELIRAGLAAMAALEAAAKPRTVCPHGLPHHGCSQDPEVIASGGVVTRLGDLPSKPWRPRRGFKA
jgi:hypothetical protein